jgi:hypothetical protein
LGLEERSSYVENDLKQAIISHLQAFLIQMGRGFCFEARQKRITFDSMHYRIDKSETLVKYATAGLSHHVFVSRYMTNLPSEQELEKVVLEEHEKRTS